METPPPLDTHSLIPARSITLYNQAREKWNALSEEDTNITQNIRPIASDLLLAIKESGNFYPQAHGFLSFVFVKMNDLSRAKEHWNIAIKQEPFQPQAWYTKTIVSIGKYVQSKDGQVNGLMWNVLFSSINFNRESYAIGAVHSLVNAFNKLTTLSNEPEKWYDFAEVLLSIGDNIANFGLKGFPNVYKVVANAPWRNLQFGNYAQQITEMRRRAETSSMMHR